MPTMTNEVFDNSHLVKKVEKREKTEWERERKKRKKREWAKHRVLIMENGK